MQGLTSERKQLHADFVLVSLSLVLCQLQHSRTQFSCVEEGPLVFDISNGERVFIIYIPCGNIGKIVVPGMLKLLPTPLPSRP